MDLRARVDQVDGVRCVTDQGWWLLRPSNTEAVLVGRVEAQTAADLQALQNTLHALLIQAGLNPKTQEH